MPKRDPNSSKFQPIVPILIIALGGMGFLMVGQYIGWWTLTPPIDDDDTGGDDDIPIDTTFKENEIDINNENYSLYILTKSKPNRSTFLIILNDKEIIESKNYILLEAKLYNETHEIDDIIKGINNEFTIENNATETINYEIRMEFFDTITGTHAVISRDIDNFTMLEGNSSNYIEKTIELIEMQNGTGNFRGEYEVDNDTILLLHMNETFSNATGDFAIDSSNNNHTVQIIEDGAPFENSNGKFLTPCFNFDGNDDYLLINTTNNVTTNQFTIDTWMQPREDLKQASTNYTVLGRQGTLHLGFKTDALKEKFMFMKIVNDTGDYYELNYSIDSEFQVNNWVHVGWVLNATHMNLWFDFVNVASMSVSDIDLNETTNQWYIGFHPTDVINPNTYIDELRILNVSIDNFNYSNYFPIHYMDDYYFTIDSTNNFANFTFNANASIISDNFTHFDINASYESDKAGNEVKLQILNYTSGNWIEVNESSHLVDKTNFMAINGCISGRYEMNNTNLNDFNLELNLLIFRLYYPINVTELNWSYYSDDNRIVLFQNETTQNVTFMIDFEIEDPMQEIFDTITYYEVSFSEGNYTQDIDYCVMVYNFTSGYWLNVCYYIDYTVLDTNKVLFELKDIPYSFYEDIIDDNSNKQTIGIKFDFSSESAKVYLDWIQKTIDYMDITDTVDLFRGFEIEYNPN